MYVHRNDCGHGFYSVAGRRLRPVKGGLPTGVRNGSCRPVGSENRHAGHGALPVTADHRPASASARSRSNGRRTELYSFLFFIMEYPTFQQQRIPHGTDTFQTHWSCHCRVCEQKRSAVARLVDSFSSIPAAWIEELTKHRGESVTLPMWGSVFVAADRADRRAIAALLQPLNADCDDDRTALAVAGWSEVGTTGVFALSLDDALILGIDGAGYDFYSAHWEPLYEQLGYHWHESGRS